MTSLCITTDMYTPCFYFSVFLRSFFQLHNLYWECAFAGTSPKSALALLIEPHAIPAEVMARAPERWTPEMIMKQFDIIQMLERLNAAMDV